MLRVRKANKDRGQSEMPGKRKKLGLMLDQGIFVHHQLLGVGLVVVEFSVFQEECIRRTTMVRFTIYSSVFVGIVDRCDFVERCS